VVVKAEEIICGETVTGRAATIRIIVNWWEWRIQSMRKPGIEYRPCSGIEPRLHADPHQQPVDGAGGECTATTSSSEMGYERA
jgi:hypothetical protein